MKEVGVGWVSGRGDGDQGACEPRIKVYVKMQNSQAGPGGVSVCEPEN